MSQFLSDWPEMNLGDISDKPQYGWSARSSAEGNGYRYLRITDMTSGQLDWGTVPFCLDLPPDPSRFLLQDDDILVARSGATFGRSIRIREPERALFASYLIRLRPVEDVVMPGFLEYFLKSPGYWHQVRASSSGLAQPNVNAKKLANIRIPVPPVEEQQRIIAAIEEQLSRLDAAEASLERARRGVQRHRHSTLLAAITDQWPIRPLGDLLISLRNGVFVSRAAVNPPGIRIFRISAVRPMSLDVDDVRFAPPRTDPDGTYIVEEEDLLFTRYSGNPAYVGACARVPALAQPTLHPDKLIRAVVDRAVAEPAYLELALSFGPSAREIAQRRKTTAGQVGIAGSQLKSVPIALPPLRVQRQIIAGLDGPGSLWTALSRDLVRMQTQAQQLRAVVLRDAFAGRLVLDRGASSQKVSV